MALFSEHVPQLGGRRMTVCMFVLCLLILLALLWWLKMHWEEGDPGMGFVSVLTAIVVICVCLWRDGGQAFKDRWSDYLKFKAKKAYWEGVVAHAENHNPHQRARLRTLRRDLNTIRQQHRHVAEMKLQAQDEKTRRFLEGEIANLVLAESRLATEMGIETNLMERAFATSRLAKNRLARSGIVTGTNDPNSDELISPLSFDLVTDLSK